MEAEIEYFSSVVSGETENIMNPPESAAETIRLVEALRDSAAQGGTLIQY